MIEALSAFGALATLIFIVFCLILFVLSIFIPIYIYLINSRVKEILKEQKESNKNMRDLLSKIQ